MRTAMFKAKYQKVLFSSIGVTVVMLLISMIHYVVTAGAGLATWFKWTFMVLAAITLLILVVGTYQKIKKNYQEKGWSSLVAAISEYLVIFVLFLVVSYFTDGHEWEYIPVLLGTTTLFTAKYAFSYINRDN
ncbi:hypothetical protein IV53_GL000365 [Ligilactobacillus ceti DSM 22408]|uniref:Uncharacterized protein n=2 Tax=Ligilactobacillus TaxID=2767887 RepID=A0A0R2KGA2_9LACO|nr:hypothetical protein [Ligilactobacillus ceti]KRN88401.1 hypothetical protein IV53_GL000365 [Ligilactobacillus ceti DSM 22408]